VLLIHRRDVVEPIEIRNGPQVSLVLDQLLGPAMQETDMWIDPLYHFSIEFEDQAQHAVCWGPKLMVKFLSDASAIVGQRLHDPVCQTGGFPSSSALGIGTGARPVG
jgi:hypothetical protein